MLWNAVQQRKDLAVIDHPTPPDKYALPHRGTPDWPEGSEASPLPPRVFRVALVPGPVPSDPTYVDDLNGTLRALRDSVQARLSRFSGFDLRSLEEDRPATTDFSVERTYDPFEGATDNLVFGRLSYRERLGSRDDRVTLTLEDPSAFADRPGDPTPFPDGSRIYQSGRHLYGTVELIIYPNRAVAEALRGEWPDRIPFDRLRRL